MNDPVTIRTAIIDDHEAIRLGVGAALQQHTAGAVRVVSSHETVDDFLGDALNSDMSAVAKGSDGACVDFAIAAALGGTIAATTGAGAGTTMGADGAVTTFGNGIGGGEGRDTIDGDEGDDVIDGALKRLQATP